MVRGRRGFMISLDKELDRINKTMHAVDEIYSVIAFLIVLYPVNLTDKVLKFSYRKN